MAELKKENPNQRKIIICSSCKQKEEHHAMHKCAKCYKKEWISKQTIVCKECKREMNHHSKGLCGGCYNRLFHYEKIKIHNINKYYNISIETYRSITKTCATCNFNKIVELHHLDGDKKNNSNKNLAGLCPNCHKLIHSFEFFQEIKEKLHKKGFETSKIHPSNYVHARKSKNTVKKEQIFWLYELFKG